MGHGAPGLRPARSAVRLAWLLAGVALVASLCGLLVDDVYTGAASTAAMLRAYDVVTALLVVPGQAAAAHFTGRGSALAQTWLASLAAYLVYTYAYYLFGTPFNDLFLLHVAVFSVGLATLVAALATLDVAALATRVGSQIRARTIAGILAGIAVALGGMWVYFAAANAVTGDVPAGSQLVETDTIVHLGIALDLGLLVPLYAAAAVLLWRRAPWGYPLAALSLLGGLLHQVSYMAAMLAQSMAGVPGAAAFDPAEPVIVLLYLIAAVLLLRGAAQRPASSSPASSESRRS